jgi:micrococcal nuclease
LPHTWSSTRPTLTVIAGFGIAFFLVLRVASNAQSRSTLPLAGVQVEVLRAVDGDTLLIEGGYRIRLIGVNAPEIKHNDKPADPFGNEAHRIAKSLTVGKFVVLELDRERWDTYRRTLAYVFLPDYSMLNERIISHGLSPAIVSFPFRNDRKRRFVLAEAGARKQQRNIWSNGFGYQDQHAAP